jgi:hypothetical protein
MSPKDEDFIRFYRDAVIAGHNEPAAETMRHFNLSRDYIVRLLNETIAGCEGHPQLETRRRSPGRSPDWLKMKNPACEAVRREEEEDWGK